MIRPSAVHQDPACVKGFNIYEALRAEGYDQGTAYSVLRFALLASSEDMKRTAAQEADARAAGIVHAHMHELREAVVR
ncbi:MAG: hypothetical protein A4E30_00299 [Methanomassiliicoccales archaeon PtaB.Bin215]|nr:MAG: hypothetical protein A4E30_00299 [Methanomassiliicoccales archaeon PtaB.Bin215]